jgi:hypothetical protein
MDEMREIHVETHGNELQTIVKAFSLWGHIISAYHSSENVFLIAVMNFVRPRSANLVVRLVSRQLGEWGNIRRVCLWVIGGPCRSFNPVVSKVDAVDIEVFERIVIFED